MHYDVIIIGGSYAGLSAGLQLARARRRILVLDSGLRRNRFAATSHGFFSRDGESPAQIAAHGRTQLRAYPDVHWADAEVTQVDGTAEAFRVTLGNGGAHMARRLIIATGVVDRLPDIPGLAERWGKQILFARIAMATNWSRDVLVCWPLLRLRCIRPRCCRIGASPACS